MYVRGLELVDFRSYPRVVVELEPGPCVLVGPNGVGKTNLVEALAYVATLSSHRVATDTPLVRFGATRAVVRCAIIHDERELLVELSIEPGKANRARLGRANVTRARDILGALKLVMFAPEDLTLVRGDPSERRRYLDDLLVSRQPRFAGVRADYDRVLKQRNALLRSSYLARKTGGNRGGDLSTLDVWDTHLAQHGAKLLAARLDLIAALAPHIAHAYNAVSAGRADARITYSPSWTPTSPVDNAKTFKSSIVTASAATPMDAPSGTVAGAIHNPDPVDNSAPARASSSTGKPRTPPPATGSDHAPLSPAVPAFRGAPGAPGRSDPAIPGHLDDADTADGPNGERDLAAGSGAPDGPGAAAGLSAPDGSGAPDGPGAAAGLSAPDGSGAPGGLGAADRRDSDGGLGAAGGRGAAAGWGADGGPDVVRSGDGGPDVVRSGTGGLGTGGPGAGRSGAGGPGVARSGAGGPGVGRSGSGGGAGTVGGLGGVAGMPTGVAEIEAALLAALAEARPSEVERGVTLVGPHRDDLVLTLGELPAKGYASHGESWSFALALRLASYDLLRADGIEPVLVLDDVFAELDAGRRSRLAELVSTASQVIVTCAVDADVPRALRGAHYDVGGGEVSRVG